jgi:hypothetical protein
LSDTSPESSLSPEQESESVLTTMLQQLRLAELRDIARKRGWQVRGKNKSEYATAIADLLTDPTEVARAVTSLPNRVRLALRAALVAEAGNGITPTSLARVMTAVQGDEAQTLKPVEAMGLLDDLVRWGLLIPWRGFPNGSRYLFPSQVQRYIPPLPGWCQTAVQASAAQASEASSAPFIQLLCDLWERISERPRRMRRSLEPPVEKRLREAVGDWAYDPNEIGDWLVKEGRAGQQTPQALSVPPPPLLLEDAGLLQLRSLTNGHMPQLDFACHMLCELDLAICVAGELVAQPEPMQDFLDSSASERQMKVAQAYLSLLNWSEVDVLLRTDGRLALQRDTFYPFSYSQFRSQLLHLRNMVLRLLATAGEQRWCSLEEVAAALRKLWPSFFPVPQADDQDWLSRASRVAWRLMWRAEQRPLQENNLQDWRAAQGRVLHLIVEGPLHWLGFADLIHENGTHIGFRLHGLAELLWDHSMAVAPDHPVANAVTVDESNGTIMVQPSLVQPEVHPFLGSIARLEKATGTHFVYRLDMHVAYETFAQKPLLDILRLWDELMPCPIPPAIHEALSNLWTLYGQVHLYEGLALLEVKDDITLRELEATTSLTQHILTRLSPNLLVLADEAVDGLVDELSAQGYTPRELR